MSYIERLDDVTVALAGQMLVQRGKADSLKDNIHKAKQHLKNGKAWEKFRQMIVHS